MTQSKEPEARIWATSTDLEGTNYQRRRLFLAIEVAGERHDVELIIGPGKEYHVEPFVPRELDYTVHDACNHEDDYCVLDDPESFEYQDAWLNEAHATDVQAHKQAEREK